MKPAILVLAKLAPWRLNGGALIRNYWMIRALAERFEVDLFTTDPTEVPEDFARCVRSVRAFGKPAGLAGKAFRLLDTLHPQRPLYASGAVTGALRHAVAQAIAQNAYAAIQTDLNMVAALPAHLRSPLIYNAHNCEYALQKRRAQAELTAAKSAAERAVPYIMDLDSGRLGMLETTIVAKAALTAACSNADIEDLRELVAADALKIGRTPTELIAHINRTGILVPNGVDTASYAHLPMRGTDSRTIGITGSMDWRPNRIGLQWFLREVLPALRSQAKAPFFVRVAGRMDASVIAELGAYDEITAIPNPPKMQDELARVNVVLAPITASSGTRLRILEAWAAKRPVVTTGYGALGLDYNEGSEIIVRDDPAELAAATLDLLDNPERAETIAQAALGRVAQYDWRPIGARYLQGIGELITAETETA